MPDCICMSSAKVQSRYTQLYAILALSMKEMLLFLMLEYVLTSGNVAQGEVPMGDRSPGRGGVSDTRDLTKSLDEHALQEMLGEALSGIFCTLFSMNSCLASEICWQVDLRAEGPVSSSNAKFSVKLLSTLYTSGRNLLVVTAFAKCSL